MYLLLDFTSSSVGYSDFCRTNSLLYFYYCVSDDDLLSFIAYFSVLIGVLVIINYMYI